MMFPKPSKRVRRRGHRDPVDPVLRRYVLHRDAACIAALYDGGHECRDAFGMPHSPRALDLLTVDHVQDGYGMMGRRAPSTKFNLVAACHAANLDWCPRHRDIERQHLDKIEPRR